MKRVYLYFALLFFTIWGANNACYAQLNDGIVTNRDSLKRARHGAEIVEKAELDWQRDSSRNIIKAKEKLFDRYLTAAAKYDYIPALYWLYRYYKTNSPERITQWMGYLETLADQHHNYPRAQYELAQLYREGEAGLAKSYAKYAYLLEISSKLGYIESQYELAKCYYLGLGKTQDIQEASKWFKMAADSCHQEAQYYYGNMLVKGEGVDKNLGEGIDVLSKAAKAGNVSAQLSLGFLFLHEDQLHTDYESSLQYFRMAADNGNAIAQYQVAKAIFEGKGILKNENSNTEAFKLMQASAENKNCDAEFMLGCFYRDGIGTEPNPELAILWLTSAAKQEHIDAQFQLGKCYAEGKVVPNDDELAKEWLSLAAEAGCEDAQYYLANFLLGKGIFSPAKDLLQDLANRGHSKAMGELGKLFMNSTQQDAPDYEKSYFWLDKASLSNDHEFLYYLAMHYANGWGCEMDIQKAIDLYLRSAKQGNPGSNFALGLIYYNGSQEIEKDYQKAIKFFESAAQEGVSEAQYNLALCYMNGQGTDVNFENAMQWFVKAANQKHEQAIYNLAINYYHGINNSSPDYAQAFRWSRSAVEFSNNSEVEFNLGNMYYLGLGTLKDLYQAFKWYLASANQGYLPGMCKVGQCYLLGEGVEESAELGRDWLTRAKNMGSKEAAEWLKR